MLKNYNRTIRLRCVVCGSDSDFESNEDRSYIKCDKCNREYHGGYDELVNLNQGLINDEIDKDKNQITKDVEKELAEAFNKVFNKSR